jgi:hypothetical protein
MKCKDVHSSVVYNGRVEGRRQEEIANNREMV